MVGSCRISGRLAGGGHPVDEITKISNNNISNQVFFRIAMPFSPFSVIAGHWELPDDGMLLFFSVEKGFMSKSFFFNFPLTGIVPWRLPP
jgi:hypothetical protein